MKTGRGKAVSICLSVLGVLVVLVTGFAFKDRVAEQWYLWKLDSDEPELRELAARKLGDLRSVRAVDRLKALLLQSGRKSDAYSKALGKIGAPAIPSAVEALHATNLRVRISAVEVLTGISYADETTIPTLMPILQSALTDSEPGIRVVAAATLKSLYRRSNTQQSDDERELIERILAKDWSSLFQSGGILLPAPPVQNQPPKAPQPGINPAP